MDSRDAMARYERIRELTRQMLAAAQQSDWDSLIAVEAERKAVVETVTLPDIDFAASGLMSVKDACINEILEMDAQIRGLTETWMGEMREMLSTVQSQRKLERTYNSG